MPSQNGEDQKIAELLGDISPGIYLDIGANDPISCSISEKFYKLGWHGIIVEPIAEYKNYWNEIRPRDTFFSCAAGSETGKLSLFTNGDSKLASIKYCRSEEREVDVRTINDILLEYSELTGFKEFPSQSFACIDVEGWEKEVLLGWDLQRWWPRIICLEAIVPYPSPLIYNYQEWESIILAAGYSLAAIDTWNRYYSIS
jgi:FkbM family methyltransferase